MATAGGGKLTSNSFFRSHRRLPTWRQNSRALAIIAIGDGQHRAAHLFDVEPRLHSEDGVRLDFRSVERLGVTPNFGKRPVSGLHVFAGNDHGDFLHEGARTRFTGEDSQQQLTGSGGGFVQILVRVGSIADHGVGQSAHALGHVGVQVKRKAEGQPIAHDPANHFQQRALRVVGAFRAHGSVQRHQQSVQRQCGAQRFRQDLLHAREFGLHNAALGDGPPHEQRNGFHAGAIEYVNESADFRARAAPVLNHVLTAAQCGSLPRS